MRHLFEEYGTAFVFVILLLGCVGLLATVLDIVLASCR